ncbi:MAG: DUF4340 domain-containing protein [Patescibacteria group bacterium]
MSKKNLILGLVLIILIALAYAYQGPLKDWRSNLGKPKNFLAKIDIEKIDRIEVIKNDEVITLEKRDMRWKVADTKGFYVVDDLANRLETALRDAGIVKLELVGSNNEKKGEFQTDSTGTEVKLFSGDKILTDFVVGKLATDYVSTYISKPGTDETYSLKVNLSSVFNQTDWRDTTIFNSNREQINKFRFQYPNREFTIEKKDEVWSGTIPYEFPVEQEEIDKIIDIMANLTSVEIPEQEFTGTGLDKHLIIVEASGEGVNNTIMVGNANENNLYYAKRGDSDNIYLITKEQRDILDRTITSLRKLE